MAKRSDTQWRELIHNQQKSGLSQVKFCQQQRICSKRFALHKRRLLKSTSSPFLIAKPHVTAPAQVRVTYGKVTLLLPLDSTDATAALIKALA